MPLTVMRSVLSTKLFHNKYKKMKTQNFKWLNDTYTYEYNIPENVHIFQEFDDRIWGAVYVQTCKVIGQEEFKWLPEQWDIFSGECHEGHFDLHTTKFKEI